VHVDSVVCVTDTSEGWAHTDSRTAIDAHKGDPMHPYLLEELAHAHRQDMLRSAETSRLAHPAGRRPRRSVRWWGTLRTRRQTDTPEVRPAPVDVAPA
jgi:hypothetical protein